MPRNQYTYKNYLGVKYPFTLADNANLLSLEDTYEVIKQNIILFFKTERGSRIMRPSIGVTLRHKLGEPLNDITRNEISNNIEEQLSRYFPQIRVVETELNQPEELKFEVIIKYKLKNRVNQIYPDSIKIIIQ